ncbi:hypothetical protein MUN78_08120 [Leucobacter allii]|uniref:Uncharacterized protein n=1 Tax=Leucobacter allii TaxID=2932247 RepID=A0ABY4FR69_9MICO|nr:hypothetical protein [Leucobacter allii]UOQ58770.1 hypothetical protein MUN78_08120 [Leucobacter allii]
MARAHGRHTHALNVQSAQSQAATWRTNDLRKCAEEIAPRNEETGMLAASSERVSWFRAEADLNRPLLGNDALRVPTPERH